MMSSCDFKFDLFLKKVSSLRIILSCLLANYGFSNILSHVQHQANAPRFRHAGGIQVITSEGSIAGRIPKRLELLTTERGLPALQKATQLSDEAM